MFILNSNGPNIELWETPKSVKNFIIERTDFFYLNRIAKIIIIIYYY